MKSFAKKAAKAASKQARIARGARPKGPTPKKKFSFTPAQKAKKNRDALKHFIKHGSRKKKALAAAGIVLAGAAAYKLGPEGLAELADMKQNPDQYFDEDGGMGVGGDGTKICYTFR